MSRAADMIRSHPRQPDGDLVTLSRCIEACYDCAQTCTSCADACLAEAGVKELVACIHLNEDCRAVCLATGEMLSRTSVSHWDLVGRQVEVCLAVCRACGEECERHAGHMEHCRICAEACRGCEAACGALLEAVPAREGRGMA